MMQQRGRARASGFWWRAAEPIPARPGRLDVSASDETGDDPGAPAHPAVIPVSPVGTGSGPVARVAVVVDTRAMRPPAVDLGGYRPASISPGDHLAPVAPAAALVTSDSNSDGTVGRTHSLPPMPSLWRVAPSRHAHPRRYGFRARQAMLAAGLAGAVAFAATTGFGRHMRAVDTLAGQVDQLMVAAGLGINEISISGHEHTTDREIFTAIGAAGTSLLSLDVSAARRRIEALSWVEQAAVSRVLPDKLKVEVRERRASAVWLDGDATALVDASGRVLAVVGAFVPPDLPRIAGRGAPEAAAELLTAIAARPALRDRVHLARLIGQRRWDLELNNGTRIRLAAGSAATTLARLQAIHSHTGLLDRDSQLIDLTNRRHVAVSAVAPAERTERRSAASLRAQQPL